MFDNHNPPTVVVVAMETTDGGLIVIQRTDNSGWALPGGFQEMGETWRQAAYREVNEELGYKLDINDLYVIDCETVDQGKKNLLFVLLTNPIPLNEIQWVLQKTEVKAMVAIYQPIESCFAAHTKWIKRYFDELKL